MLFLHCNTALVSALLLFRVLGALVVAIILDIRISQYSNVSLKADLYVCYSWRYDKTFVVAVHHDNNSQRTGRNSPRVLVGKTVFVGVGIFKRNVKHLGEVLTQVM